VYGLGYRAPDEAPFLIMQLVRGRTLHQAIADYHRPPDGEKDPEGLRRLLHVFVAACRALAYAHGRGVVHRDPKPGNILLDDRGGVKVADWGLAKLLGRQEEEVRETVGISDWADTGVTQSGAIMGTPAYMSPEQARGLVDQIDARSDIYVLGAVLFEILTGQRPHRGHSPHETIRAILEGAVPRARSLVPSVSPVLDAICVKAMARAPGDRYAQVADLARDVACWLAGEAVSVYRESWFRRLGGRLRRAQTALVGRSVLAESPPS
jgi:serine/threonine protein kinase